MRTSTTSAFFSPGSLARQEGVHPSAVYRWISPGLIRGGRTVRLRGQRRGGRLKIAVGDWEQFLVELNAEPDAAAPSVAVSTDFDRKAEEAGL